MSSENNIKTIQKIYGAFGRGDVATIVAELSDDVKWGIESASSQAHLAPWHARFDGKRNAPKFFAALAEVADFTRFEPYAFVADDKYVYATISWDATVKPTGKKLSMQGFHRFTFDKGRITEWLGSEDTARSIEAMRK